MPSPIRRPCVKSSAPDFEGARAELATFKPAVDKFFDDVMVMDKDEALKKNRLALMGTVNALFLEVADFRQLQFLPRQDRRQAHG